MGHAVWGVELEVRDINGKKYKQVIRESKIMIKFSWDYER
jgi:hypothetical protein